MHSLCRLEFKLELPLGSKLELELEFELPWQVANTELLVGEVEEEDTIYCMR